MTLLINGGQASLADVRQSIHWHRPVVVSAGTGRLADAIAELGGEQRVEVPEVSEAELSHVVASGVVEGCATS